jgi:hypothetical protein
MTQRSLFGDDPPAPGREPKRYAAPLGSKVGQCRSCGAALWWVTTETGASMPLSQATAQDIDGQRMALPHWIDCPTRDQHRRKG